MGLKINQKEEKTNMCKAILEIKQEGRAEGRAEGIYDKAVTTARKALSRNIPRDVIADITGLTIDEVAAL